MSALGQKRSFRPDRPRVRFAPIADIRQRPLTGNAAGASGWSSAIFCRCASSRSCLAILFRRFRLDAHPPVLRRQGEWRDGGAIKANSTADCSRYN